MKVIINTSYGGFGLSLTAIYLLHKLGFPLHQRALADNPPGLETEEGDFEAIGPDGFRGRECMGQLLKDGMVYSFPCHQDPKWRSHPVLVAVVEHLGARAAGRCADLAVMAVPDGSSYCIEEDEGKERLSPDERGTQGFEPAPVAVHPALASIHWFTPMTA